MQNSKVIIPIRNLDSDLRILQDNLLNDGSINFDDASLDELLNQLPTEKPISSLLHSEVRYEVTDHCNASCIMCPRDEHEHGRAHGIMDQKKYEKSIDEVVTLGAKQIVLTGFGEPMLDKNLEAGLDEIRISFYGMGEDTYNTVMQGLDFERTRDGLLKFIKLRDEQNFKTKIQISYLTLPENEKDQQAFQDYWEPLVDAIEIWRPHNFGDGRDYRDRDEDQGKIVKTTCGRPETGALQIQWDGEVIPCCYDYNNKIVLGNAFEQPVLEILNEKKYRLLRYAHKVGLFNIFPYCDQCDQLLPHSDALVYTNRHNLPAEEAVKLSNTDLYNLSEGSDIDKENLNEKYKSKV